MLEEAGYDPYLSIDHPEYGTYLLEKIKARILGSDLVIGIISDELSVFVHEELAYAEDRVPVIRMVEIGDKDDVGGFTPGREYERFKPGEFAASAGRVVRYIQDHGIKNLPKHPVPSDPSERVPQHAPGSREPPPGSGHAIFPVGTRRIRPIVGGSQRLRLVRPMFRSARVAQEPDQSSKGGAAPVSTGDIPGHVGHPGGRSRPPSRCRTSYRQVFAVGDSGTYVDTNNIYTVIMDLVCDLGEKGWLRDVPKSSYKHRRILSRFIDTGRLIGAAGGILSDPGTYGTLGTESSGWTDTPDRTKIIYCLALYHIVQSYELITKILTWMLDDDKLALKRHPTIFNILDRLEHDVECGRFRGLLNNGLRNALAHGDYCIERDGPDWQLVYEGAPGGRITFDKLADESNRIQHVVTALRLWYLSWLSNDLSMRDLADRRRRDPDLACC